MKQKLKMFIIACIGLALLSACSSEPKVAPQNVRWYSLDNGLTVAGESDKKVLVYFWAKW